MISNISIKNFKSVVDVSLPLGRFNLLIGANGCGKSNILEGIAMGAAASSNKLDYEYFANRGMRVVEPQLMLPAFDGINTDYISIDATDKLAAAFSCKLHYNSESKPAKWVDGSMSFYELISFLKERTNVEHGRVSDLVESLEELRGKQGDDVVLNIRVSPNEKGFSIMTAIPDLEQFLIYSLEESKLRQADDSNRTYPLGRHGEGLFAYLKELAQRSDALDIFNEIKDNLKVLDWFDDMQVPSGQLSNEFNLKLKDSYLAETINIFDQRSTNEGFLYLLFYLTLIISDETPRFFAIENIDTAFNPKLCREVTRRLIELARKHNKQIIATTHNPAVLDGMDLYEDDVRLHVVRRSIDGYTKTNRVTLKGDMTMPLSEAWQKGFIGGLPDNF